MAGRPKGSTNDRVWRDALRKAAFERLGGKNDDQQIMKAARALVASVVGGDSSAAREFGDRIDGKVPQAVTGADGGPLTVVVRKFGA